MFPPQPASVAKEGFSNDWKPSEGANRYRRGLYTWIQRLSPYAHNVTFDAPSTNAICVRRERTNSPLQALALLNDPVFDESARMFAERMLAERMLDAGPASEARRIEWLMRTAVGRRPTPTETRILTDYLREAFARGADELGAWTGVCSVILNLHEFVTRG